VLAIWVDRLGSGDDGGVVNIWLGVGVCLGSGAGGASCGWVRPDAGVIVAMWLPTFRGGASQLATCTSMALSAAEKHHHDQSGAISHSCPQDFFVQA